MSKQIDEIFYLRSISCLAIVFLHTLTRVRENYIEMGILNAEIFSGIELLLKFGTPIFILISEVLIAYKYSEDIPRGFLIKRAKYLLIPFTVMAIFYGITTPLFLDYKITFGNILENFLGGYHGYFILIIFQFYILHIIFVKYLKSFSPKKVLIWSLIINIIYLAIFNLTPAPESGALYYLWVKLYYMPFIAWIFYFVCAFYIGSNYGKLSRFNLNIRVFLYPILTGLLLLFFYYSGIIELSSSKRFDMIFYSLSMTLLIIYLFRFFKFPKILNIISKYSFGIYLIHMFYIYLYTTIIEFESLHIWSLPILFILVLITSIFTVWVLNKVPYGEYIVGKVGLSYKYK